MKKQFKFSATYFGETVSKERPRLGRGGRVYTPDATKNFEAAVAKWAEAEMWAAGEELAIGPLLVKLEILDPIPDKMSAVAREYALEGMLYCDKNDVDNITKAILDALNKVMYKDDRQVKSLSVSRRYALVAGFNLSVYALPYITRLELKKAERLTANGRR
jgi:Holliday junction resolvase RusA-like endonuclease